MKKICVLGLGYIGLPTASIFATHGYEVVGVDTNPQVISTLQNGGIHIEEPGLNTIVQAALRSGNLRISAQAETADAFIIAVPTPFCHEEAALGTMLYKRADMKFVEAATRAILPVLKRGDLVILESTSPPRTTIDLVKPILEASGLVAGDDFYLTYSPERVMPGQILKELVENDRVVGGVNQASAEAGRRLYEAFVKGNIFLTDSTTAEMVKVMENTYRDVNIAIANEFALIAEEMGIDVWEAIQLANRHPRVKILRPGPGVGGHCIAVDPWFLVEAAPQKARLIYQARQVNDSMPGYVVARVKQLLAGIPAPVVACLGLTYKADIDDMRESPAAAIVEQLVAEGFQVRAYDPYVRPNNELKDTLCATLEEAASGADLILVLVDHAQFKKCTPEDLQGARTRRIFDTRNCLDEQPLLQAGWMMVKLGRA